MASGLPTLSVKLDCYSATGRSCRTIETPLDTTSSQAQTGADGEYSTAACTAAAQALAASQTRHHKTRPTHCSSPRPTRWSLVCGPLPFGTFNSVELQRLWPPDRNTAEEPIMGYRRLPGAGQTFPGDSTRSCWRGSRV